MISNEILSAYIDGELPAGEMQRVRDAISGDEVLAARYRQFARVDQLIVDFCGDIDKEPLPAAVLGLLQLPLRTAETLPPRTGGRGRRPAPGSSHGEKRLVTGDDPLREDRVGAQPKPRQRRLHDGADCVVPTVGASGPPEDEPRRARSDGRADGG